MKEEVLKLTENGTIKLLMKHLEKNGWHIESHCLDHKHGCDIIAIKNDIKLLIEVKGAKVNDGSKIKKRPYFDSGQIKTHFGKAIVKIMDDKYLNPKSQFAIAHPNDLAIKKAIGNLTPFLKEWGIKHFWVSADGSVKED